MLKSIAWFFASIPDSNDLEYGVTLWEHDRNASGASSELRFDLAIAKSGTAHRFAASQLIANFSAEHVGEGDESELIIEDDPFVNQLVRRARSLSDRLPAAIATKREGALNEQVSQFGSMIHSGDRFFVPEELLVEADLAFPKSGDCNLIDEMFSDEQVTFPQTQSLLIACHELQRRYSLRHSVTGRFRRPNLDGYGGGDRY